MPTLTKNPDGSPHVHEYVRVADPDDRPIRYRCAHPDCTHFLHKNLLSGKRSLCAVCHKTEIVMNYENLRRTHPRCFKCSGSKKAAAVREKFEVLDRLFGDM